MGIDNGFNFQKNVSATKNVVNEKGYESMDDVNVFIKPEIYSLLKETKGDKKDSSKIYEKLVKLREKLVLNMELVDATVEDIDEEFKKHWRDREKNDFLSLIDYVKKITEHAFEKENILRSEQQTNMEKRGGKILNQLMVCDAGPLDPKVIAIHISPNKTISFGRKLVLLRDGLHKLAEVVEAKPTVESIEGQSWIIRDYPDLVKQIGFKIEPQLFKRLREFFARTPEYLKADGVAKISRKDFLDLYLKK